MSKKHNNPQPEQEEKIKIENPDTGIIDDIGAAADNENESAEDIEQAEMDQIN